MSGEEGVRRLTSGDVAWMADLMVGRRARYEVFSPVFWRPAAQARDLHEPHLASCVASGRHVGLRTENGFVLGELQSAGSPPWWSEVPIGFIDDFAVLGDDAWIGAGRQLLVAAWSLLRERGAESLRVVTARRDTAKVAMLESLDLSVGESWWVRAVEDPASSEPMFGPLSADGIEALLIPAPPVYDPGGPVLLVTSLASVNDVQRVPTIGGERSAVLAILPTKPGTPDLTDAAEACGFDETSRYYVGQPADTTTAP
jgi:ribosomal protein S18 acetylase RimI-like enzyme